MTPKEKADELIGKYDYITDSLMARHSAWLAVDEILTNAKVPLRAKTADLVCSKEYWLAVKDEIEKL